jgi:hypothetical protein
MRDVAAAKPRVMLMLMIPASLPNSVWERRHLANSVCFCPERNRVLRSIAFPNGVRERG